jgi:hypothetical protein
MALPWMHTRQPTASPFKIGSFVMSLFIMGNLLTGCVSYRLVRGTEGRPIPPIFEEFRVGKTTLQEALETLGAPDQVAELEGKDVLIYRRSLIAQSGLSFGIPLVDIWVHGFDFSAYGRLIRYDLLLLLFTPDGILREIIIEKGSHSPYLETILSETLRAPHSQKISSIQGQYPTNRTPTGVFGFSNSSQDPAIPPFCSTYNNLGDSQSRLSIRDRHSLSIFAAGPHPKA